MAYLHRLINGRPEWAIIDSLLLANENSTAWAKLAEQLQTREVARLLLPYFSNRHWRLIVVNRNTAEICCYDSLPDKRQIDDALAFVRDVVLIKKLGWARPKWSEAVVEVPRQEDGHSCGPYILWWAKQLVEDACATLSRPAATWRGQVKAILQCNPTV
jgi:Ulp1 family protease